MVQLRITIQNQCKLVLSGRIASGSQQWLVGSWVNSFCIINGLSTRLEPLYNEIGHCSFEAVPRLSLVV